MLRLGMLGLILVGGCDFLRDPTSFEIDPEAAAVHAMLLAGEPRIAVLVTRFEPPDQPGGDLRLLPFAGAEVRVTGAGQTFILEGNRPPEDCVDPRFFWWPTDEPLSPGCYAADVEGGIMAGSAYDLHILLPNGAVVTGSTEVLEPVTIQSPDAGATLEVYRAAPDTLPLQPLPLAWRGVGSDRAIHLRLEAHHPDCGQTYAWGLDNQGASMIDLTGQDSANVGAWVVSCYPDPAGAEIDGALNLAAFDSGYVHYLEALERNGSLPPADAALGVTGATGLFTSAAITRRPVRLVFR